MSIKRKTKKSAKGRAHTTFGFGSMKKNRGKGNKGGTGNAGSGKKGDCKRPSYNVGKYFGKSGFTSLKDAGIAINLFELRSRLPEFEKNEAVQNKSGLVVIDLGKAGISKLLGLGNISEKYHVIVKSASTKAINKIESLGGKVELPKPQSVDEGDSQEKAEA
jgi:large subunit ribosomal protein L15